MKRNILLTLSSLFFLIAATSNQVAEYYYIVQTQGSIYLVKQKSLLKRGNKVGPQDQLIFKDKKAKAANQLRGFSCQLHYVC